MLCISFFFVMLFHCSHQKRIVPYHHQLFGGQIYKVLVIQGFTGIQLSSTEAVGEKMYIRSKQFLHIFEMRF